MRTNEIKTGDRIFDDRGNYYGVVRKGIAFRGDCLFIPINNNFVPFRDAYEGTEEAKPITLDRATIVPTVIPGVWMVKHGLDLSQRVHRERLEFALYDTFNLMG